MTLRKALEADTGFKTLNPIALARQIMWEALAQDPGFMEGYRANVAMRMYDELHARGYRPKLKPDDRNALADSLLELIFKS